MKYFLILCLTIQSLIGSSQGQLVCANNNNSTGTVAQQNSLDSFYLAAIAASKIKQKKGDTNVVQIPVVFHIVYHNQSDNLSDTLIHQSLQFLNERFRNNFSDTHKIRDIFKSIAADAQIEFELATTNPDGNATTGIIKLATEKEYFGKVEALTEIVTKSLDSVKQLPYGSPAWDTRKYLNIWVCPIYSAYGYGTPPTNDPHWDATSYKDDSLQGIVLNSVVLKKSNRKTVIVHEAGHFFGLRHTSDNPNNDCTETGGDYIDDTPLCKLLSQSKCDFDLNSCNASDSNDLPDQIENYMCFSPDECKLMFTKQQVDLMRYNLTKYRSSLCTLSVSEKARHNDIISVFPNPTSDKLSIISNGNLQLTHYSIKNYLGKECLIGSLKTSPTISISELNAGVYFITISAADQQVFTAKFIKVD